VSWVKRLLSPKTSNWKVIPRKYLDKFGKKLANLDSISFIYIFGTTHELAKKVNFGRMSVFIIRIVPIIVRFLFPHAVN
jgi:hypothetical protein